MIADLRRLQRDRNAAQAELERAFKATYPAGAAISWVRDSRVHCGCVIDYAYNERLKVRNQDTGNAYFITMADVLRI